MKRKFILLMFSFCMTYNLWAQQSNQPSQEIPHLRPIEANNGIEKINGQFVTIVKIEKPSIATREYLVNKFVESIPVYSKVNGLLTKYYSLTENGNKFGGIYLWGNEDAPKIMFNPKWFEGVQKAYNSAGEVKYYTVTGIRNLQTITETKGNYWSVLSLGKPKLRYSKKGLLRIIYVTDEKGVQGHISIWSSVKEAKDFFSTVTATNEFFDTPILLNNK